MRPEDVRQYLERRPFQPLRLTLTDGRTYDVYHPDLLMVGRSSLTIGLPRPGDSRPVYDRIVTVSLLHVMQVEATETPAQDPQST